jgi:hypothetical protein
MSVHPNGAALRYVRAMDFSQAYELSVPTGSVTFTPRPRLDGTRHRISRR